jgi:hypothetical protein
MRRLHTLNSQNPEPSSFLPKEARFGKTHHENIFDESPTYQAQPNLTSSEGSSETTKE